MKIRTNLWNYNFFPLNVHFFKYLIYNYLIKYAIIEIKKLSKCHFIRVL